MYTVDFRKKIFNFVQGARSLGISFFVDINCFRCICHQSKLAVLEFTLWNGFFIPIMVIFFLFVSKQFCLFRLFRNGSETPKRTETNRKNNLLVSRNKPKMNRNRLSFGLFRFEPKILFVCFEDTLVVILWKRQFYERMYTFTTCCGGPLYGPAEHIRNLQIRKTGFTPRAPLLEKS
jgi:hypothetical protein